MLVNCVVYEDGAKLGDIPVADISEHISRPGAFVWVALRDATDEELREMQGEFDLHPLAVEDAHHGHQRPKIEEYDDSLFAVLHALEFYDGELSVGEINVFVGANYILTVRNRSRQSLLGVRDRCEREPGLLRQGAGFVFYAVMDAVVDRYFPVIAEIESALEALEERIFEKGHARANIEALYALKRKVTQVRHVVTPLLEAVGKLQGGRVPAVCADSQAYFRDVYDHLTRINSTLETVRETLATAIQVNLSMVTIEESEVNKKLAAWAGIFAVITAFAGIWGMNFKHMPELDWPWAYPMALLTMALTSAMLYRRFRRVGWL